MAETTEAVSASFSNSRCLPGLSTFKIGLRELLYQAVPSLLG
jgi:hypothetical protein